MKIIINNGENINSDFSKLEVISIPDEVTGYEINEYDGMESIVYVLDGSCIICRANAIGAARLGCAV